ncbi:tryptophan-rich sensory protein [Patescibacteria group bacterium]|nr:tryptophan-rich sensory protein [Patescibacteria group bacterium]
MLKIKSLKKFLISLLLPQLAGFIGSFFTRSTISSWYAFLIKPSFNPPNWLFGPAWITLYFLMGISIYLIWTSSSFFERKAESKKAFTLFWIHLIVNSLWSLIFFGLKSPVGALVNIIILWISIIILIIKFWRINKWASCLLIPYFFWVTFASILNYSIWHLN